MNRNTPSAVESATVSPLIIRRFLRGRRRHLAIVAASLVLGGAVVTAHSGVGAMHMPDMAVWCLAVLPLVAALGRAVVVRPAPLPRPFTTVLLPRLALRIPPPVPRARAGPTRLTVLRL